MAKTNNSLPDLISRRSILFGKEGAKTDLGGIAGRYFEAGRMIDALDFFVKGNDEAGIERIEQYAVEHGDAFLLHQVVRLSKRPRAKETWAKLGAVAERDDKIRFAIDAFREAGDLEAVKRLGGEVPEDDAESD